jgi:hypothetical protein
MEKVSVWKSGWPGAQPLLEGGKRPIAGVTPLRPRGSRILM